MIRTIFGCFVWAGANGAKEQEAAMNWRRDRNFMDRPLLYAGRVEMTGWMTSGKLIGARPGASPPDRRLTEKRLPAEPPSGFKNRPCAPCRRRRACAPN